MMEVGEVQASHREVSSYSVSVDDSIGIIRLNVDENGVVVIVYDKYGMYKRLALASFSARYLRSIGAAINAVLEAMEEKE
jgi:hypothetical protein